MKSFKALFVLALVLGIAAPAYAETQNVKVSGSIDAYAFWRSNYDLRDNNDASVVPAGAAVPGIPPAASAEQRSEADNYFRTNTQVEVSADLTDNVSTVINLVNQRDWNATALTAAGVASTTATTNEFDIQLDLAYVKMKEIFYSPLTLTIGRQDLWFGRGFIVGNNNRAWDTQVITQADEYSVTTAFDAIRATLDFSPWTLDFVYSKISEGTNNPEDDVDLYIANVNYKFAEYNAVAEGYYIGEMDRNRTNVAATGTTNNETDTLGGRVQFDPISQITLGGELAYEFGKYRTANTSPDRDRDALGVDLFGTYRWDNPWKPEVTVEWVHFSGEGNLGSADTTSYTAWNPLYRGRFWTAYGDFREFLYATADTGDQPATTNQDLLQVPLVQPLQGLLQTIRFEFLRLDQEVLAHPDLPEIVQQARIPNFLDLLGAEDQITVFAGGGTGDGLGQPDGQRGDALAMPAGGWVPGLNGGDGGIHETLEELLDVLLELHDLPGALGHHGFQLGLVGLVFPQQGVVIEGAAQAGIDFRQLEGFLDEIVGAPFNCLDGGLRGRVAGHDDAEGLGIDVLDRFHQFEACDAPGHVQVRQDDRVMLELDGCQGGRPVFRPIGLVALGAECLDEQIPKIRLVVHDEDRFIGHPCSTDLKPIGRRVEKDKFRCLLDGHSHHVQGSLLDFDPGHLAGLQFAFQHQPG